MPRPLTTTTTPRPPPVSLPLHFKFYSAWPVAALLPSAPWSQQAPLGHAGASLQGFPSACFWSHCSHKLFATQVCHPGPAPAPPPTHLANRWPSSLHALYISCNGLCCRKSPCPFVLRGLQTGWSGKGHPTVPGVTPPRLELP